MRLLPCAGKSSRSSNEVIKRSDKSKSSCHVVSHRLDKLNFQRNRFPVTGCEVGGALPLLLSFLCLQSVFIPPAETVLEVSKILSRYTEGQISLLMEEDAAWKGLSHGEKERCGKSAGRQREMEEEKKKGERNKKRHFYTPSGFEAISCEGAFSQPQGHQDSIGGFGLHDNHPSHAGKVHLRDG